MNEHTPGPWAVKDTSTGSKFSDNWREIHAGKKVVVSSGSYTSSKYDGESVCGVRIMEANANLIAAAPELLESVNDFLAMAVAYNWTELPGCRGDLLQRARAAIKKAEGQL